MKSIFFNQNNYIEKNNFTLELKKEVHKMLNNYFKEKIIVPTDFKKFDKEISDLIIKILDEQDIKKNKTRRKKIYKIRKVKIHTWKSQKIIK